MIEAPAPTRAAPTQSLSLGIAAALLIGALFAPLYLRNLGAADIVGDDEAREVGIIQDMILRGHWMLPRFNGTTFPDKPVLYHWLGAAACSRGPSCDERAVRLPSALAAVALVALVGIGAARLFDTTTGIAAALLLGLTPFLFEWARSARPDVLLTLLLTAALLTFYDWWRDGARSRVRAAAVGTLLGLGVLAKGPVAPTIAAVAIAAFLWLRGDLRVLRRLAVAHVLGPFALLAIGWYAIALLGWGEPFARAHLVRRYLGNLLGGPLALGVRPSHSVFHHLIFYPLHLLLVTLPWTPLLVAAAYWIGRDPARRSDPRPQFLFVWLAAVLLAFIPAALKLRHYLLPALPAVAMLAAWFTAALVRGTHAAGCQAASLPSLNVHPSTSAPSRRARTLAVTALVAGLAIALVVWFVTDGPSRSDRDLARALGDAAHARPLVAMLLVTAGIAVGAAALWAARCRRWRALLALGGCATLTWMLLGQPFVDRTLTAASSLEPFATVVRAHVPTGSPLYFFGPVIRPLVVYVGRPIPRFRQDLGRADPGGAYLIVLEPDLPHVRSVRPDARILADHTGRVGNLARGRVALVQLPRAAAG
jgi:4-amino-4-deoxy-L-arabinose transferase-like glycosyltransferase